MRKKVARLRDFFVGFLRKFIRVFICFLWLCPVVTLFYKVASSKVLSMILFEAEIKFIDIEILPLHTITDMNSVLFSQEKRLRQKERNTHTRQRSYTHITSRTWML